MRLCLVLQLLALVATQLPGQVARLQIRLAADPHDTGPAAWRYLRNEVLPGLEGWPRAIDPARGLRLTFEIPFAFTAHQEGSHAPVLHHGIRRYFDATLTIESVGRLRGLCDFEGRERWEGQNLKLPRGRLLHLARLLGIVGDGPAAVDTVAWIANMVPGDQCPRRLRGLLVETPKHCGILSVDVKTRDDGGLLLRSTQGNCGLLLPLVLGLVADYEARPRVGGLLQGPVADDLHRWLSLAHSGLTLQRQEAARQLGYFESQEAIDSLERLLQARDGTRLSAMRALARLGSVSSAQKILAAVSPRAAHSEDTARRALQVLWQRASPKDRLRLESSVPKSALPPIHRDLAAAGIARANRQRSMVTAKRRKESVTEEHYLPFIILLSITSGLLMLAIWRRGQF